MSADDIQKYLERHIDDDVRFKSTIVYRVGDMPSEQTSIVLKKAEYMENIKKGAQTLQDYDSQVTVRDVKISSDGRRATVLTESRETGTMPIAPDDHTPPQYVPVQGTSTCNQVLTLDGEGIIRIYSAVCSTDIRFEG
ncbi:MAG: hypothetical protein K9G62_02390 [Alphaproteobacteria bacterium]|nr:hypothetical protein [Alphaproteobacteria bacterium]